MLKHHGSRAVITTLACVLAMGLLAQLHQLRADEVADALVAQERMRDIRNAVLTYANDSACEVSDLTALYGNLIDDPQTFHHPGDPDPAPLTIDNETPNALNSAQISFTIDRAFCSGPLDRTIVRDNGPENNNGLFTLGLTIDGHIVTEPPDALPLPTSASVARANLARLVRAMRLYCNDNEEWLPDTLSRLYPGDLASPASFWNPGDEDPPPTHIENDVPDGANSALVSFDYPAAGMREWQLDPQTVVIKDNAPSNNNGYGVHVAYWSGRVQFIPNGVPGDRDDDGDVDLRDLAGFQTCMTTNQEAGIIDDSCRVLDFDGDNQLEIEDFSAMAGVMTGPLAR